MKNTLDERLRLIKEDMDSNENFTTWLADLEAANVQRLIEVKEFKETLFNEKFDVLKKFITEHKSMDCDDTNGVITSDEFYLILAVIQDLGTMFTEDTSATFHTVGLVYKGVVFEEVSGQGTFTRAFLAEEGTTIYPLNSEFVLYHDEYSIVGVYRHGKLIAKDVGNAAELLQLLGFTVSSDYIESSDDLPELLEDL